MDEKIGSWPSLHVIANISRAFGIQSILRKNTANMRRVENLVQIPRSRALRDSTASQY